jgi:hypothetical protein
MESSKEFYWIDMYTGLWKRIEVYCYKFQMFGVFCPSPKSICVYYKAEHAELSKTMLFHLICFKLLDQYVLTQHTFRADVSLKKRYKSIDEYIVGNYVQPLLLYDSLTAGEVDMLTQFFTTHT